MSYEVLAQKWRPQSFREVVGQTHVITTLQNQIRSERVGHAYLFWGPRGTGKTTVARLFAKAVNCPNRHLETEFSMEITAEPCNQCQSCDEISHGRCLDVIEMDAASNRGIDPIRELRENTRLAPAACPYKVYIVDEVHMLTSEAFNALLKTLEEPPSHVIFILATTDRHKVPKTITSRCQDFDFRYLEQDGIIDRLQTIGADEAVSVDDEVLSLVAHQSEGCLRDAENLLERLISSAGKELTLEKVQQLLGLGASHLIDELIDAILERNLEDALSVLANLAQQGTDLTTFLHQLIAHFRDLRLLTINPKSLGHLIQGSKSDLQRLKETADRISTERASRIIKILMRTNSEIKQHGYARVQLEIALSDICSIQEGFQLGEILRKLAEVEDKIDQYKNKFNPARHAGVEPTENSIISQSADPLLQQSPEIGVDMTPSGFQQKNRWSGAETASYQPIQPEPQMDARQQPPQPTPQAEKPFKSAPADVRHLIDNPAELEKHWERTLAQLQTGNRGLYSSLKDAALLLDDDNTLKIAISPTLIQWIQDDEKQLVTRILIDVLGGSVQVKFVPTSMTPELNTPQSNRKTQQNTPMMMKHQAERDEQIAPTLQLFDAEILKIEQK